MPTPIRPNRDRWRIPIVLVITVLINYLDRNNLSLALPASLKILALCDREIGSKGELLLAAFFLSYALSNMLLSPLAERFGAKRSVMMAIGAFSVITMLSAPLGYSFTAMVALRLLLGLGEGVHIPMLSAIISHWFLPGERCRLPQDARRAVERLAPQGSRANAIWGSGILLSTVITPLIIVPLIQVLNWRLTFAILGIGGMLLQMPLVYFLVPDKPPRESRQDPVVITNDAVRTPLTSYFRERRFWLTVVGGSLNAFCAFGLLNWLSTYFNRAKGIYFQQLGWSLALVFASGIVGIALMAYLGDKLQQRTQLAGIGFLIAGVMEWSILPPQQTR